MRNRVKILESKRDNFDAEYETPRYEEMIAISFDMEEQKRANADEKMKFDANREMQRRANEEADRREAEQAEMQRQKAHTGADEYSVPPKQNLFMQDEPPVSRNEPLDNPFKH